MSYLKSYLKNQSFLSLLTITVVLLGLILITWWIFSNTAEAPETAGLNAELEQVESDFEELNFDEQQLDRELNDLEKEIQAFEGELGI